MARPREKEVVMTKVGKRTYKIDKKTGKKKTWRPTVFTPEVVSKLEELFSWNTSVTTACKMVGIWPNAYYVECNRNPQFKEKMEKAQSFVDTMADRTIAKAIRDGDVSTSKRYKEKTDERYKTKPTQINMQQEASTETGEVSQGLSIEFTLKE